MSKGRRCSGMAPEASCSSAEPAEQIGDGLLRESTAGPFQGHRGSQDGGQWGAKLVGDRCQEDILLLLQGGQPSGGLTLGHGLVGDVEIHPLPAAGFAAVVIDNLGFIPDPDRAPVGGSHAVGAPPWFECLFDALVLSEDAVSVRGVQERLPEVRGAAPLGRIPQATLDLRAVADPRAPDAIVLDIGGGWELPCPGKPCPWFHFRHQPPQVRATGWCESMAPQ
jgi:hypothetical protein